MRTVTSDRLVLRPWRDDDADFLLDLESRWEVVRFLGAHPTTMTTRDDALASIGRLGMTGLGRTTRYYDAPHELFEKLPG